MNVGIWISRRLRLNGGGRGANATGVVIAVVGVALAVMIMEFTLAIVVGFKNQITERVVGFDGQISILPAFKYDDGTKADYIEASAALDSLIATVIPQAQSSLKFTQPGLLKTDSDFAGVYFIGYDSAHHPTFERSIIVDGELPDFSDAANANSIAISTATARSLGLKVGDKVNTCFFVNDAVKSRKYTVAALYESGFSEYDKTVAFAPISALRKVAGTDSLSATSIVISGVPTSEIESTAEALQQHIVTAYQTDSLADLYPVDNVKRTGAQYFSWLDLLDTNVVVIFVLMLCVAGFTLVSSMFILILERIPTIGILRALGATKAQIRTIFINMALRIVGMGLLIGNVVGLGLLLAQQHYKVMPLDPEMYYLHHVPVEINWWWMLLLNVGVVVVTWLILILPSRVASGISPAVTIRYE